MNERLRLHLLVGLMLLVMLTAGGMVVAQTSFSLTPLTAEAAPEPAVARSGTAPLMLLGFALMCILPLAPGLLEVLWPRDRYPLPVNLDYAKDPRYLGNSFRRLLDDALAAGELAAGVYQITLSQPESVQLSADHQLAAGAVCPHILVVRGDLEAADNVVCEREVRVQGKASIGDGSRLRAVAGDRDVHLGRQVEVLRWIDAGGDLTMGSGTRLGQHCSAGGWLLLAADCRFARLSGAPILTPGGVSRPAGVALRPQIPPLPPDEDGRERTIDRVLRYEQGDLELAAGATVTGDVVVRGDLTVGAGATVAGSLRTGGAVRLRAGVQVLGSIFADGPVHLAAGVTVAGHVFSQDTVAVEAEVQVGRPGAVKSLVGNRGITLGERVVVHGYVLTEGEGVVRCTGA